MKKIPLRWSLKCNDLIYYRTKRGKIKVFTYGKQTWYRRKVPNRAFQFFRNGREFRLPTISEQVARTLKKRSKKLKQAICDNLPLFTAMRKAGVKSITGGRTTS